MTTIPKKRRWLKILLIGLAVFVVIILVAAFAVNRYWSPILEKKVKSAVTEASDSLYKIDFSSARLKILQGRIIIYNITLKPDTAVYRRMQSTGKAPNNIFELKVNRIVLKHVHPFKLYFQKRLDIGQIVLSAPELRATYQLNQKKDTAQKDNRTLYDKIKKSLKSAHVGEILLNDVKLKYEDRTGSQTAVSELKELNLMAKDLLIDSASMTDNSRYFYCKDIITDLHNFKWQTKDKLYTIKAKHINASTATASVSIGGINVEPAKDYFERHIGDRFTLNLDSLLLNNFDYDTYNKSGAFSSSSITLLKGNLTVANNSSPKKPKNVEKSNTFPQVGLQKIKSALKIDTIRIKHLNVQYNEFNRKSGRWGTVSFSNTTGKIINLTTDSAALKKNNLCQIYLDSYFMGKGKLNVQFTFNLTDKSLPYSYKGSLGPMDMGVINQAHYPLAMVKLTSGRVTSLNFNIQGNKNQSNGRLSFLYRDLKVKLLKMNPDQKTMKGKTIVSLLANAFIIKRNNPDNSGETPRSFYITYLRPYNSPFFKTVWKTLLTGLKPCAGYSKETEEEMNQKMEDRDKKKDEKERKKKKEEQEKELKKKKEEQQKKKRENES